MNELESYYQQNAGSVESMGFEARQGIASRTGALNVFEAKASAEEEETTQEEKQDEEGGGVGVGAGILSKEGIEQVGKQVLGKAKSFAQQKIQSVVDDIKTNVQATRDATAVIPQTPEEVANGLESRFNALPDNVKPVIRARISTDPNAKAPTSTTTPDEAKLSNDAIDKHISDGERFGVDPPPADIPAPLSSSTASTSATSTTVADSSIARQLGSAPTSTPISGSTPPTSVPNPTSVIDDATENLANKASNITQKGMDTLSDKLGVDFGDLSTEEVGSGLASTLSEGTKVAGAVSKVSEGLEAFGGLADFLGPVGMIGGLIASVVGLVKGGEEKREIRDKQSQITTMADNINTTAGMSFGSIASTNLDTSQFRSGGLSSNF
tara:strand:- start:1204 stop:2349 length:1146 start_codon:yes stop_codon:yes gene_type:complete